MQLFNLKDDIGEQNDLMATEPDKANDLKKLLHNWRESVGAKMMEENPNYNQ
jgi:arylsulfatase A